MSKLTLGSLAGFSTSLSSPHIGQFLFASLAGAIAWTQKTTLTALASQVTTSLLMLSMPAALSEERPLNVSVIFKQLEEEFGPIKIPGSLNHFDPLTRINLQREIRDESNPLSQLLPSPKTPETPLPPQYIYAEPQVSFAKGNVIAPIPRKISQILVKPDNILKVGDSLVTIEVMKSVPHISLLPARLDVFGLPIMPVGENPVIIPTNAPRNPPPTPPLLPSANNLPLDASSAPDSEAIGPFSPHSSGVTALSSLKTNPLKDPSDLPSSPSHPPFFPVSPKGEEVIPPKSSLPPVKETQDPNLPKVFPIELGKESPQIVSIFEKAIERALKSPEAHSYNIAEWQHAAPSLMIKRNKGGFAFDVIGHIFTLDAGYITEKTCKSLFRICVTDEEYKAFKGNPFFKKARRLINDEGILIEEKRLKEFLRVLVTRGLWKKGDIADFLEAHDPEVQAREDVRKAWAKNLSRNRNREVQALPLHPRRVGNSFEENLLT